MNSMIDKKKQYQIRLCKLVELDEEYDHLHFYVKLEHRGKELAFCIQFADLYDLYEHTEPGLRSYVEKFKEMDEFFWDCDARLLQIMQEEGMELEHFVAPLFDHVDINELWKNTTGKLLGKDASGQKITKAAWKAHYEAIDQYVYVPQLHQSSNYICPKFYKSALKLALKHYPDLAAIPNHWKREIRLRDMEFVADCWSFYEICEFHRYEQPDMPTNEFEETKEEMRKNLSRRSIWRVEERNPMFCVEAYPAAHQWEVVGENSMLIGYKVTTATGLYYDYVKMSELEDEARLEFPDLFDIIWKARCAAKGVSPKGKETYALLASQGFDWTPLLASHIWKYVEIKGMQGLHLKYLKHAEYVPGVLENRDRYELGEEIDQKIPFIQTKWRLYDDLVKLTDKKAHQEFPIIFEPPLHGGYWYYYYNQPDLSSHAMQFADFCCEMVFAFHNLRSEFWPRYE